MRVHCTDGGAEVPRARRPSRAGYRDTRGNAVLRGGATCALWPLRGRAGWRGAWGGQGIPSLPPARLGVIFHLSIRF